MKKLKYIFTFDKNGVIMKLPHKNRIILSRSAHFYLGKNVGSFLHFWMIMYEVFVW